MSASHPEADFALTAPGIASTANGCQPTPFSIQPGCCNVTPLWPHTVQRAHRRSLSEDSSGPHRMTSGGTDGFARK